MAKKTLKVVVIEDAEEDVFLMQRALEKGNLKVDIRTVCTSKDLSEALEKDDCDVILSDFNLPRMNGFDALRIRQEKTPHTPFIVVTGSIGEEAAIELMKAGADDYIIKNNVKRLATAVRQAVRTSAMRKAKWRVQARLKTANVMLTAIADGIQESLLLLSPSRKVLWANKSQLELLGLKLGDIRGRACHEVLFGNPAFCTPPDRDCPLARAGRGTSVIQTTGGRTEEIQAHPVKFREHGRPCFIHVGRDITKLQESRAESLRHLNRLQKLLRDTIEALSGTIELRDPYTAGHQKRVSHLATSIAREIGMTQNEIDGIYLAAIVHDLGKVAIPTEILTKPSRLDETEFSLIKTHPQTGFDILKKIEFPWPVARAVLEHHERLNGVGYPAGLKGDRICQEAKILAVADVVEAIASHRPYRPALGLDAAIKEIEKNAGILYDKRSVEICLDLLRSRKFRLDDA